jgi:hypothetical protein
VGLQRLQITKDNRLMEVERKDAVASLGE